MNLGKSIDMIIFVELLSQKFWPYFMLVSYTILGRLDRKLELAQV